MRNAFTARLHNLFKPGRKGVAVGLELQAEGMALVASTETGAAERSGIEEADNKDAKVASMDFLRYDSNISATQLLKNWVGEHRLNNAACHVVLGPDTYQILLVEPPDVPQEELRSAIRWRLKDLINIPVEQAALDVFALPADGVRSNKKMIYVVVCEKKKIQAIVDMVGDAGLSLDSIDIGELALRNLVLRLLPPDQAERGVALARIRSGMGSIFIYRVGNLYLGRSFSLSYNGGLLDSLPEESLALELQRSLDYYERQMGQSPPVAIYICGEHVSEDKIGPILKASLAPRLEWLNPISVVRTAENDWDDQLVQQCVGAIGGALRQAGAG